MCNEGGLNRERLHDLFRSSVTISQFPALSVKRLPENLVDIICCSQGDLTQNIQQVLSPSFKGLDGLMNESRKEQSACNLLTGALRSAYSFHSDYHPNSIACDRIIDDFLESWDEVIEQGESTTLASVIDKFEKLFSYILQSEIARLESTMGSIEREFWLAH